MVFAATPEKKAMEKLAPVTDDKRPIRVKGAATVATLWVQLRASIKLPTITPKETKSISRSKGQNKPDHKDDIVKPGSTISHPTTGRNAFMVYRKPSHDKWSIANVFVQSIP